MVQHANATLTYSVTLDTTPLAGYAGPFYLDLQLTDGFSGINDVITTATVDNFSVTGGSMASPPEFYSFGGTSWDGTTATLGPDDPFFFSQLQLQFTPGSQLSFDVHLTDPINEGAPDGPFDRFTAGILHGPGPINVPTTDPSAAFFTVDLSPTPVRNDYLLLSNVVPEPSIAFLLLTGLVVVFARRRAKALTLS